MRLLTTSPGEARSRRLFLHFVMGLRCYGWLFGYQGGFRNCLGVLVQQTRWSDRYAFGTISGESVMQDVVKDMAKFL